MMKLGVQVAKGCHFHVVIREDRMMICGIVLRQHRNVTDDRRHPYIDRRLAKNGYQGKRWHMVSPDEIQHDHRVGGHVEFRLD